MYIHWFIYVYLFTNTYTSIQGVREDIATRKGIVAEIENYIEGEGYKDLKVDVSQKSARHHIFFVKSLHSWRVSYFWPVWNGTRKLGDFCARIAVSVWSVLALFVWAAAGVCVCAYSSGGRGGGRGGGRERGGGVADSRDMREPRHTQKSKHIYEHTHTRIHLHTHTRTRSTPAQRNEQPCTGHEWNNL